MLFQWCPLQFIWINSFTEVCILSKTYHFTLFGIFIFHVQFIYGISSVCLQCNLYFFQPSLTWFLLLCPWSLMFYIIWYSQLQENVMTFELYRGLVNDTYKMDLILVHPPYLIALACIYIASVLREKDTTAWFEELHVDMNVVSSLKAKFLPIFCMWMWWVDSVSVIRIVH